VMPAARAPGGLAARGCNGLMMGAKASQPPWKPMWCPDVQRISTKSHTMKALIERVCYLKHTTALLEIAGPINFNMESYDCAESEAHHIGLGVCDVPHTQRRL